MIALAYVSPDSPSDILRGIKHKYPDVKVSTFYFGEQFIDALREGYRPEVIVADRVAQEDRGKRDFVDEALSLYQPKIIHSGPVVSGLHMYSRPSGGNYFFGNKSFDRDFPSDDGFAQNMVWKEFRSEVLDGVIKEILAQR